jgi:hypothetical protein
MRLRLYGTPSQNRAMLAVLSTVLETQTISRPYPDRPPSTLERIYLDAEPLHNREGSLG